jgi:hypothetical protein
MERLMTKQQVSERLNLSPRTIDRYRSAWEAKGLDCGVVKIKGRVRFRPECIAKLIENPSNYKL